ncbi:4-galactosyl-N-acetylglucosaminide 3-alpha-L-fucosyltransferase FUT6-like isoform X2 [Symsagittifera roscoffensis]|uniref:4-galactosyl-N-acetylglucosaminide 3-alpha-L-fucosyltransferase FUT6-like isoform X2 n=1 Tax=Symsagittifera roscoffensis TaxID=84072 RepID=UPI00307B5BD6
MPSSISKFFLILLFLSLIFLFYLQFSSEKFLIYNLNFKTNSSIQYNFTTPEANSGSFGPKSNGTDFFSIIDFPYSKLPSMSQPHNGPIHMREFCHLSFDCVVYSDLDRNLPLDQLNNFSALIAAGPARRKIEPLMKKIGINLAERSRTQFWITSDRESAINPGNGNHLTPYLNRAFNWSATYGNNVTFFSGMSDVEKLRKPIAKREIEKIVRSEFAKKTKLVCWIMSNCAFSWTNRLKLVSDLVQSLPEKLNFWGRGENCLRNVKDNITFHGKLPGTQFDLNGVIKDCVFYLAFENSNCSHYITEKFSNALNGYAIPIVNGWRESYVQRFLHTRQRFLGYERIE